MKHIKTFAAAGALMLVPTLTLAQDTAPGFDEIGPYIMTTLLFCMAGFLVFFMAAGFAMLEGGLVRSKNVTMQMTKNIALYSFAAIMYWLVGFNTMYPGDFNGYFAIGGQTVLDPVGIAAADAALDYASIGSDFFFQLVFVAATASIVSGALAERIKLWPFLIFVIVLTGFMYPISGSWQWGGGWLSCSGRCHRAGSADRQVWQGRQGQPDPGLESRPRHAGHIHPVARLVRLQRRLAAGDGHRGRCLRRVAYLCQHQHGSSSRRGNSAHPDADHVQEA